MSASEGKVIGKNLFVLLKALCCVEINVLQVWIQLKHIQYLHSRIMYDTDRIDDIGFLGP